jgi:hypothetical protein
VTVGLLPWHTPTDGDVVSRQAAGDIQTEKTQVGD